MLPFLSVAFGLTIQGRKNEIRANYTILSKMKLCGFDHNNAVLVKKYRQMRQIVRSNFGLLLKMNMPFSRKKFACD